MEINAAPDQSRAFVGDSRDHRLSAFRSCKPIPNCELSDSSGAALSSESQADAVRLGTNDRFNASGLEIRPPSPKLKPSTGTRVTKLWLQRFVVTRLRDPALFDGLGFCPEGTKTASQGPSFGRVPQPVISWLFELRRTARSRVK